MAIIINQSGNTLENFSSKIGKDVIVEKIIQHGEVVWQAGMDDMKVTRKDSGYFENDHVGIGDSSEAAILMFTKLISGKELVYKDFTQETKRFDVPILDY